MLDGHHSCILHSSHPVIMPWSFSSSLHHHPVINFSENSLRQGPLIYYVYIPARVYRNFDKENFKNISLLKSLKRNFFEKKFVQVELVQLQQTFPLSFLVDPPCSVYFIQISRNMQKVISKYILSAVISYHRLLPLPCLIYCAKCLPYAMCFKSKSINTE